MAQRCWSAPGPLPPVYLCIAAPLRHCPIDSVLPHHIEHLFCSFCEQKQRIDGALAHCSTWGDSPSVHFVNRSSEAMEHCSTWNIGTLEQRPSVSRPISPCMRVLTRDTEANTIASLHLESLRHSGTADHRQSAAARTHHVIRPLRRSVYASGLLFYAAALLGGTTQLPEGLKPTKSSIFEPPHWGY